MFVNLTPVRSLVIIAVVLTQHLDVRAFRHLYKDGTQEKYSFVVALLKDHDRCTGTLISPNWVLTAAHCLAAYTHLQYGNMTVPFNKTTSTRQILLTERPPVSMAIEPDIGLIYVNSVPMGRYAQLSAVDYKSLAGHVIEYVVSGFTQMDSIKKFKERNELLWFKEGAISSCDADKTFSFSPYLCVAPKCSDREQLPILSEPGSPLFHAGKLVGVQVGGTPTSLRSYTPVSPYLAWIHRVISSPHLMAREGVDKVYMKTEFGSRRFATHSIYSKPKHSASIFLRHVVAQKNVKNVTRGILEGET